LSLLFLPQVFDDLLLLLHDQGDWARLRAGDERRPGVHLSRGWTLALVLSSLQAEHLAVCTALLDAGAVLAILVRGLSSFRRLLRLSWVDVELDWFAVGVAVFLADSLEVLDGFVDLLGGLGVIRGWLLPNGSASGVLLVYSPRYRLQIVLHLLLERQLTAEGLIFVGLQGLDQRRLSIEVRLMLLTLVLHLLFIFKIVLLIGLPQRVFFCLNRIFIPTQGRWICVLSCGQDQPCSIGELV